MVKKKHFTSFARLLLTLVLVAVTSVTAWAAAFINEVMLVGGTKSDILTSIVTYHQQGWTFIDQDLNEDAGGDYILLCYKTDSSNDGFNYGNSITGFYISNTYADHVTYGGRTYYPVPCKGGKDFVDGHGDLNEGCGEKSDYIYLYYTRDGFPDRRVVSGITFNSTKSGAVGLKGSSTGYDLNSGAGGDYIYMHVSTTAALEPLQIGDGTSGVYYLPLNMSRSYSLVQQLYTAEEIGTAGTISAIAFYYRDVYKQPFTKKHTRVYLKQTDSSSLSGSTTEAVSENNGYTLVYDGPFSATSEGWIYLRLSTPYEYDGNQNLIVCCYDYGSDAFTGSQTFTVHKAPGMAWSYGADSSIDLGIGHTSMFTESRNDIRINITPNPYRNPVDLAVTRFTDRTASVSWSAPRSSHPAISGYEWQYRKSDESAWSALTSTTGTTADLTGLSAFTEYSFRVRVVYKTGSSSFSILRFVTAVELPYECGFENGMPGWSQVDHNHYYNEELTGIKGEARRDGEYGYRFRCYDSDPVPQYLISPGLPSDKETAVSFYYRNYASSSPETFQVGYSTSTRDVDAFIWGEEITASGTEWLQYRNEFPAGTQYVAVKYISNKYYLYLDDFEFVVYSSYPRPTGLSASELGKESVTLKWTAPAAATGYAYQYKRGDESSWPAETFTVNGTSVTLKNLMVGTTYDFRVLARFGDNSSNYETFRFMTEGPDEPLPHFQDFENGMGGWRLENGHGRSGITTSEKHEGVHSFEFDEGSPHAQYLRSPMLEGNSQKVFSFYYRNYTADTGEPTAVGYRSVFRVGWSTKTNRLTDFVVGPEEAAENGRWTRYSIQVPGDARYVLIMVKDHQAWLYVDDISITEVPKPEAVLATVMGESKYVTTFYDSARKWRLAEGALAYTVEKEGEDFVFYCTGDIVPAGTPVVIMMDKTEGDTETSKKLSLSVTTASGPAPHPYNVLRGADAPVAVSEGKVGGQTVYVLGIVEGKLGFYKYSGDGIPAGKAYILED